MVMATAGFSLELESGALTRCQGLSITCLCRHAGTLVASDGTKLYRLGGETDDGTAIPVLVTLPATDGGEPGPKRLRAVRLEGHLGGRVGVTSVSDSGSRLSGATGPCGGEGCPGRGHAPMGGGHGRFWRLELTGDDGAPLDLGAIEAVFANLDRRLG
jgi:hypothetical protein